TQMLLPVNQHRIPAFRALRDKFYAGALLPSENDAMSLGLVGSVGFLCLIASIFAGQRTSTERGRLRHGFGVMAVLATLVGSAGGFATFLNLIGIPVMRTYNRVSIFLAFLALMAIFSIIDDLIRRYACRGRRLVLANLGLAGLLVMGLYDQSGAVYIPPF